jgi:K+-transporting ATPase c subunit
MRKISLILLLLFVAALIYATQIEVIGEVFSTYSG